MTKSKQEQLDALQEKIEQAKKKEKQLKAEIRNKKRREETRKKILIGAALMSAIEKDLAAVGMKTESGYTLVTLNDFLKKAVTNKKDREFLKLDTQD